MGDSAFLLVLLGGRERVLVGDSAFLLVLLRL